MTSQNPTRSLVSLRPRADRVYVTHGDVVLAMTREGHIDGGKDNGLFAYQTRLISRLRYRIDGLKPQAVALSSVEQDQWMGYFALEVDGETGQLREEIDQAMHMLELRVRRNVLDGVHEDVDLTNYSQQPLTFTLRLEVDGDFADISETKGERQQHGDIDTTWRRDGDEYALRLCYRAEHEYDHQGDRGVARIERGVEMRVANYDTPPQYDDGTLSFEVTLQPKERWHTCLRFGVDFEGDWRYPPKTCGFTSHDRDDHRQRANLFLREATAFKTPDSDKLSSQVVETLDRATRDLAALRMYDLDKNERAWIMAAGMPIYAGIFGRDTLTTSWQAAMTSPDMMDGTLAKLAEYQATEVDDWRDAQPGRMLHQSSKGPLSALNFNPFNRYYGSLTTSDFYPFVVAELWHWTGDMERVQPYIEPAVKAMNWLLKCADENDDGLFAYSTRSEQGVKNQGWKDSSDAIVYPDGSIVPDPITTCEEQAFAYAAMLGLSEVLWWAGRHHEARVLFDRAGEHKKRFNDAFWMPEHDYLAMALDPDKERVRSIASNPGHCVAAGIVDEDRIAPIVDRLFSDELFSGWGIRTLSSEHTAYNPYSYHRGSVWPSEHGAFAIGLARCGLHERTHQLCKALFETASLYEYNRLPEVLTGHPRDEEHPFPALYPKANWPQAWSASTTICAMQAMLGLYPYAPLHLLFVDPHLPDWLPEITLQNLRIGDAHVSIHVFRNDDGSTDYRVDDLQGKLHVVRQPSPWSMTSGFAERTKDLLTSLLPGR